jgi:dynein heavy chain
LGYLAEHMDPNNGLAPLFEAQLELREPDLVFTPSLDPAAPGCFTGVVEGLINDIVKMASLIPRIALCHETASYEVLHYRLLSVASKSDVLNNGIFHENSFRFSANMHSTKISGF